VAGRCPSHLYRCYTQTSHRVNTYFVKNVWERNLGTLCLDQHRNHTSLC
jgi:hypothetical protein